MEKRYTRNLPVVLEPKDWQNFSKLMPFASRGTNQYE
jgi:hypothetical protein